MKKVNRLSVISATVGLTGLLLAGCSPVNEIPAVYGSEIDPSIAEETSYIDESSSGAEETEYSDESSSDEDETEYSDESSSSAEDPASEQSVMFSVKNFLYENDVEEVPVKFEKLTSYDDGDVFSVKIQYDEFDETYFYDAESRMNVGTFYVTADKIYLLTDRDDTPSKEEFLSKGIVVYSGDDSSEEIESENLHVDIKHEGDICTCSIWSTVGESGFYYNYEWTKEKGLALFRSGYGAEGEPIEIYQSRLYKHSDSINKGAAETNE